MPLFEPVTYQQQQTCYSTTDGAVSYNYTVVQKKRANFGGL